jgi:hypothetical protein
MLRAIEKDPNAVLPYRFDWSEWLEGDTITDAMFEVSPADSGLVIESQSFDAATCTVWLSGGVAGQTYTVTCRVFPESGTAHGMRDDRSILVRVKER